MKEDFSNPSGSSASTSAGATARTRVLLIEDNPADALFVDALLGGAYLVTQSTDLGGAIGVRHRIAGLIPAG